MTSNVVEIPPEDKCEHGDILVGKATVKAHKHGWILLGGRFVSQKDKAILHAQKLNAILLQC
ncbi:hypothetical protein HWQ46_01860 [Shewanella sp. D64]|uniref:hypothetical protein n=1 Tax=unclassified Shewanella TaxID=196818 RepID=UPI0022BA1FD3|nr:MULTISPECIES: hypothetical protein [unclassified Shewanella]MEC4724293.1 hypothetical protein [Shewanella sp. D64]MEC4738805.1 hypothetical protein [Shewanella sp. E94]WBJ97756.1 hypothetical protein HWQ47_11995 [Shewanella sp. MTB7]